MSYICIMDGTMSISEKTNWKPKKPQDLPRVIQGDCDLNSWGLTSLIGGPEEVEGDFKCQGPATWGPDSMNIPSSLEGAPVRVGGSFYCSLNPHLTSLRGLPKFIGGNLFINNCGNLWDPTGLRDCQIGGNVHGTGSPIWDLIEIFPDFKTFQESLDYNYITGPIRWFGVDYFGIDLFRFGEAMNEFEIDYLSKVNRKGRYTRNGFRDWRFVNYVNGEVITMGQN